MTDPRIDQSALDAATDALALAWMDSGSPRADAERVITTYLAAADKAATITTFTGAQVNKAGWVCGACEPGDYTKCDDCQSACDDVAQFVNRLIEGTE